MDMIDTKRITTKLFVGCRLSQSLRIELNQSSKWKQSRLFAGHAPKEPIEVHHEGHDYLGFALDGENTQFQLVMQTSDKLLNSLNNYLPELDTSTVQIYIFPQVFVR